MATTISSSSFSSTDSSQPNSRSTTPSSDFGDASGWLSSYYPTTCVFLPGISVVPYAIKNVFEKHASGGCLGVILAHSIADHDCAIHADGTWTVQLLNVGDNPVIEYFVSTIFNQDSFKYQVSILTPNLLPCLTAISISLVLYPLIRRTRATLTCFPKSLFGLPPQFRYGLEMPHFTFWSGLHLSSPQFRLRQLSVSMER